MNDRFYIKRLVKFTLAVSFTLLAFVAILALLWFNPLVTEMPVEAILLTVLLIVVFVFAMAHYIRNIVLEIKGWMNGHY